MEKNILALDLGKGSLGVAISRSGMFITPLGNPRFHNGKYDEHISYIKELMKKEIVEKIVIGYPSFPSGDKCEMSYVVEDFIKLLNENFPKIPVIKQDERYSTVEASNINHSLGENSKKQKKNIDSTAACVILERYLKNINQI